MPHDALILHDVHQQFLYSSQWCSRESHSMSKNGICEMIMYSPAIFLFSPVLQVLSYDITGCWLPHGTAYNPTLVACSEAHRSWVSLSIVVEDTKNLRLLEQCRVNFRRVSPSASQSLRLCSLFRMVEDAELNFYCVTFRLFASCSDSILQSFDICYSPQAVDYFYWWQFCILIWLDVRFRVIKERMTWWNKETCQGLHITGFIFRPLHVDEETVSPL